MPETAFVRIPQAARQRYTGDRLSYLQAGPVDAPAIVLLHGIGAHAAYFRWVLAGLSPHWRVIAWNAPGYWLSDNLVTTSPSDADYAQALADFLDALGLHRVVLAGNSFGSAVAQAFAIHHPERVSHLVLTGTGVGQEVLSPQRREAFEARARRVRDGSYQYGDVGVDHMVGPATSPELRALLVEITRAIQPEGLQRAVAFRLGPFFSPRHAQRMRMPVLMLQGSEDRINPREENADLLLPHLPNGRLDILEGVGHLPEVEVPEWYLQRVTDFLRATAGTDGPEAQRGIR